MVEGSKTRICFILTHLPQGGAERQTINLIRGLNPSYYDITLLLYAGDSLFYREVLDLPVRLITNRSSSGNKIHRNIENALFLRRALRKHNFDILHTLLAHNGFWVRLLAPAKYKNRIIYSIRNDIYDNPRIFLLFEKLLIRNTFVVTNSQKVLRQFREYIGPNHQDRTRLIYNGFETLRFKNDRPSIVSDELILGTVGRQSSQKNQIQIIEAVAELRPEYPVHLFVIGDKAQDMGKANEDYVRVHRLEDHITILDSQPGIEAYYKRFNIFVLSSVYESCPNVLFEAMLAKCLCIVSSRANTDLFIRDGENGLVYDGSLNMLKEKIIQAISLVRNGQHLKLVEKASQYADENFSMERMIGSYEEIYNQIMARC
jgi:glycosyltransferase involved in cell wall biosynthesis